MVSVKRDEETSPEWGKKPSERSVEELACNGIVFVDKPCGPSSHEVSAWVKRITGVQKTGHSGTLDPQVSGVLPVGLDNSTKILGTLLEDSKEYVGIIKFHANVGKEQVEKAFKKFTGEITQLPPVRSAVKRVPRKRKVYYLVALEYSGREVLFKVGCEAGTYIRKLCHDIGIFIGCQAHMLELRRTKAGGITEKETATLQQLSDALWLWKEKNDESLLRKTIHPLEAAVRLKKIWISDNAIQAVCTGAQLAAPGIIKLDDEIVEQEKVALLSLKGELVSIARAQASTRQMLEMKNGIVTKTLRVIMPSGTYPKHKKKQIVEQEKTGN